MLFKPTIWLFPTAIGVSLFDHMTQDQNLQLRSAPSQHKSTTTSGFKPTKMSWMPVPRESCLRWLLMNSSCHTHIGSLYRSLARLVFTVHRVLGLYFRLLISHRRQVQSGWTTHVEDQHRPSKSAIQRLLRSRSRVSNDGHEMRCSLLLLS